MSKLEKESRKEIGKLISDAYFDGSIENFNKSAYFRAISVEMRVVDSVGDLEFHPDGKLKEREQHWRYSKNDVSAIIENSIKYVETIKNLEKNSIATNKLLETDLHGKSFYPRDMGPLPIPESELPGTIFYSNHHYFQCVKLGERGYNYYLRDMKNKYFFRTLYIFNHQFIQQHNNEIINYQTLGRNDHGNSIIVGLKAYDNWQFSLFQCEEVLDADKMLDVGRDILRSAEDIAVMSIIDAANASLVKKTLQDLEKRGFTVKNQELLDSMGGNPNSLTDEEFEVIFGEPRH